jgi:hypothetical protein
MDKTKCKVVIVFFILLTSLSIQAQVPNGGFELWSVEPTLSMLMPDEWTFSAIPGVNAPVTSSTTSHSGTLAARGEVVNTGFPYPADRLTPILISIPPGSDEVGFAVTEKYAELTGFYQFQSFGGDELHIMVTMLHDTTGIAVGGMLYSTSVSTYTPFSVAINYSSGLEPNFCMISITICSSPDSTETHTGSYFLVDDLNLGGMVSIPQGEEPSGLPDAFILKQNYPNPFNPATKISYSIAQPDFVILKIYNILGQEIQTLVNKFQTTGNYTINFDAKNLSSGIYFYELNVGNKVTEIKKMILMR